MTRPVRPHLKHLYISTTMTTIPKHTLSKSTFMKGCQCPKALYLKKHHAELKDEISAAQQAIFSRGTNVGELAQGLFPGGVDASPADYYKFQESVVKTQKLIAAGEKIIYEAAFQFDGVLCALDILVKKKGNWYAYEVKSSTGVSKTYHLDASLQYYVITNAGIDLKGISIVHINNQYVRNGAIDIEQLFTIESVLEEVQKLQPSMAGKIKELKGVLKLKEVPDIKIGPHCSDPYGCDFQGHCWKHIPTERSVFNLSYAGGRQWDLHKKGIYSLEDVPDDYPLNDKQKMQVSAYKTGEVYIDKDGIRDFLKTVKYPMYFFDFETIMPAVPMWNKSTAYQQITFQYSLHYQGSKNGKLQHSEFLAETSGVKDPRIALIEQLIIETEKPGQIWVYHIGFERSRLQEIARDFPKYRKAALSIADRLVDLMIPFQQRLYYAPDMDGRYSIKKVLPALVPELSYGDLEIQEGGTASAIFESMISGTFEGNATTTREHLLAYCKLDTLAMVRILEKLQKS